MTLRISFTPKAVIRGELRDSHHVSAVNPTKPPDTTSVLSLQLSLLGGVPIHSISVLTRQLSTVRETRDSVWRCTAHPFDVDLNPSPRRI